MFLRFEAVSYDAGDLQDLEGIARGMTFIFVNCHASIVNPANNEPTVLNVLKIQAQLKRPLHVSSGVGPSYVSHLFFLHAEMPQCQCQSPVPSWYRPDSVLNVMQA